MKEVKVLVDNLKDKSVFDKEIEVKRNGKVIKVKQHLLLKDDIYSVSNERCKELVKAKVVEEVKKETPKKDLESENRGE